MINDERLTLTVEEAGKILGISRATAFKLCNEIPPKLPIIRLGHRILVSKAGIEKMLNDAGQVRSLPPAGESKYGN